jgi:UDP-2,3-diacylglucosamine hydrolase
MFVGFMERLRCPDRLTHLFLVGDVFDLWIANHRLFRERFPRVVSALRRLKSEGCEIHFFEGNHDLYLDDFFGRVLGLNVHRQACHVLLPPFRLRVEHGDQMDPSDRGYLFLRWFLRTLPMEAFARAAPESLIAWLGETASRSSRRYTSGVKATTEQRSRDVIRRHAEILAHTEDFDLIVSGHVHVRDDVRIDCAGRSVRSVNLGSWFDSPQVFLLTPDSQGFVPIDQI